MGVMLGSRRAREQLPATLFVSAHRTTSRQPELDEISVTVHFLGSLALRAGIDVCRFACMRGTPLVWLLGTIARTYPAFQEVLADEAYYVPAVNGRRAYWWSDLETDGTLVLMPSVAFLDWPERVKKGRKFARITCLEVEGPGS